MGYWKTDGFSQTPNAIRLRLKREVDDEFASKMDASNKRCKNRKKARKVASNSKWMVNSHRMETQIARIRHHLSKGRDAADIAVREGWMVSDVVKLIELAGKMTEKD